MARPAPGQQATNANRWLRRRSRFEPSLLVADRALRRPYLRNRLGSDCSATKPCLADRVASFAHGPFLKIPFFSMGRAKIRERNQMSSLYDSWY
ncbi:MAG: hypothetical protein DLM68_02360 [Hyphomicrobiales bacterium]|nr:MAG: hypothetical protein DLM68_02360 [Hyphomicrobiales bacterium]